MNLKSGNEYERSVIFHQNSLNTTCIICMYCTFIQKKNFFFQKRGTNLKLLLNHFFFLRLSSCPSQSHILLSIVTWKVNPGTSWLIWLQGSPPYSSALKRDVDNQMNGIWSREQNSSIENKEIKSPEFNWRKISRVFHQAQWRFGLLVTIFFIIWKNETNAKEIGA